MNSIQPLTGQDCRGWPMCRACGNSYHNLPMGADCPHCRALRPIPEAQHTRFVLQVLCEQITPIEREL